MPDEYDSNEQVVLEPGDVIDIYFESRSPLIDATYLAMDVMGDIYCENNGMKYIINSRTWDYIVRKNKKE